MNKKLIALAIASAVSMPALADSSNVTLYGMLDAGVDSASNVTASNGTNNVGRVSDYGSYFGLKGSEDLGGGLSGIWQIEQGVSVVGSQGTNVNGGGSVVNGGGSVFGANQFNNQRNSFVGLSSTAAGSVLVGIHDTPYKMSTASMDPFADTLGDYNGIVGSSAMASNYHVGTNVGLPADQGLSASNYFDLRPSSVLAYVSPNMGGLTVVGAYVFGDATNTGAVPPSYPPVGTNPQPSASGDVYSIAAMYNAGPLYLTAAYEKHDFGGANNGSLGIGPLGGTSNDAYKLGASYTIMDTTLSLLYEDSSDNFGTGGTNLLGHSTWYGSIKHTMGAWDVMAAYAQAGNANNAQLANGASTGADQWSLGGDYNFSKNTSVFALYTHIANDAGAYYNFADTTSPVAEAGTGVAGATVSAFSLGIKHTF